MRRRQPWLLAASLCILIPAAGRAQQAKPAPDSNVVLARHLLETTHQGDNLVAGIEAAMSEQRRQNTQLPAVFYDSLLARLKRTVPEVLDSLAPLYARRFKRAELQEIIHFFESPAGQAYATQQASLGVEAIQLGQRWGARVAADVIKSLVDAGVDITKP
jgi:hypothetical protein